MHHSAVEHAGRWGMSGLSSYHSHDLNGRTLRRNQKKKMERELGALADGRSVCRVHGTMFSASSCIGCPDYMTVISRHLPRSPISEPQTATPYTVKIPLSAFTFPIGHQVPNWDVNLTRIS